VVCIYVYGEPRAIHSFPTRRPSDLSGVESAWARTSARATAATIGDERGPRMVERSSSEKLGPFGCSVASPLRHSMMIGRRQVPLDRKSTRLNSSHLGISYAVFCLKK